MTRERFSDKPDYTRVLNVLLLGSEVADDCPLLMFYGGYIINVKVIPWENSWFNNTAKKGFDKTLRMVEMEFLGETFKLGYDDDSCLQIRHNDILTTHPYEENDWACFQPIIHLFETIYQNYQRRLKDES